MIFPGKKSCIKIRFSKTRCEIFFEETRAHNIFGTDHQVILFCPDICWHLNCLRIDFCSVENFAKEFLLILIDHLFSIFLSGANYFRLKSEMNKSKKICMKHLLVGPPWSRRFFDGNFAAISEIARQMRSHLSDRIVNTKNINLLYWRGSVVYWKF